MATTADIQAHYDIEETSFFQLFLDHPYLAYTCAVWENATTLEEAQVAKFERLARFADVTPGDTVLDVGCGWGGMMRYLVDRCDVACSYGLTLSANQQRYIEDLGDERLRASLETWDGFVPPRPVDAIVAIGALEHFATLEDRRRGTYLDRYRAFFEQMARISTSDARLGMQFIVVDRIPDTGEAARDALFLVTEVFPGSALPSIHDVEVASLDHWEMRELRTIGLDYVRTLIEWRERLVAHRDAIVEAYSEALYDSFDAYFQAAQRQFEGGYANLAQVALRKRPATFPMSASGSR